MWCEGETRKSPKHAWNNVVNGWDTCGCGLRRRTPAIAPQRTVDRMGQRSSPLDSRAGCWAGLVFLPFVLAMAAFGKHAKKCKHVWFPWNDYEVKDDKGKIHKMRLFHCRNCPAKDVRKRKK